jgi:hypothetical protein
MSKLDKRFPRYSRLLRLYPAAYRQQYSGQMLQTLADMLDDRANTKTTVWLRTALDFPFSLVKQNILYMSNIMTHETPDYVKRSSLAGTVLLSPFFIFIILDSLTSHSLYSGWFWHPWVVATWLIFMPGLAFFVSISTFLRWSAERKRNKQIGFRQSLFDWRRNWSMAAIVILSLGIIALAFGHDSVHCVAHNPIPEIRYWHTTLRCVQTG